MGYCKNRPGVLLCRCYNGDQPDFLNGDAAQLEEHKTIIYDYLCPFPEEYEKTYTPSEELTVPACTANDWIFMC